MSLSSGWRAGNAPYAAGEKIAEDQLQTKVFHGKEVTPAYQVAHLDGRAEKRDAQASIALRDRYAENR